MIRMSQIEEPLFPFGLKSGTFIDAPLKEVHQCLLYWASGNPANREIRGRRLNEPFPQALQHLEPRFFNPDRAVLVALAAGWTGFFDNHSRHFSPAAELFILCQRLKKRTCFFFHETEHGQTGSSVFIHNSFSPPATVKERMVWLAKESRWEFRSAGEPLPFENLEVYQARRIRDRLPPALLRQYGEGLGIPFWDPHQYTAATVLLGWRGEFSGQRPHGLEAL
jgi:hypothetical protein